MDIKDRVPTKPNRKKITYDDGRIEYAKVEFADEPSEAGTPINKTLLNTLGLNDATHSKNGTAHILTGGIPTNLDVFTLRYKAVADFTENDTIEIPTGKNLLHNKALSRTESGITVTKNPDGSMTLNGTCSTYMEVEFVRSPGYLKNLAGKQMTMGVTNALPVKTKLNVSNKDYSQTYSILAGETSVTFPYWDTVDNIFLIIAQGAVINNYTFYPQMELGSAPTAFAKYTADVYTPKLSNNEPLPDGHFKSGAVVTCDFNKTTKLCFFKGGGGNALKEFNVFTGITPPTTFEGVWLKTTDTFKNLQVRHDIAVEGTWNVPSSFPKSPVFLGYGGLVNNELYGFGSYGGYKLNLVTKTWTGVANDPSGYTSSAFGVSNGTTIYIIGGQNSSNSTYTNKMLAYNPNTNTFESKANMPYNGQQGCACYADTEKSVYCVLRYGDTYYFLRYSESLNTWTSLGNKKLDNMFFYQNKIYGFDYLGGYTYDISKNEWRDLARFPQSLNMGHQNGFIFGSRIYLCSTKLYIYDISTNTYTVGATIPVSISPYSITGIVENIAYFHSNYDVNSFNVLTTSMPENSYVVLEGSQYPVKLANSKNIMQTQLIQDAWIYKNGSLQTCEGYYGNGTQWIKFK